jgi:hypothetical protein
MDVRAAVPSSSPLRRCHLRSAFGSGRPGVLVCCVRVCCVRPPRLSGTAVCICRMARMPTAATTQKPAPRRESCFAVPPKGQGGFHVEAGPGFTGLLETDPSLPSPSIVQHPAVSWQSVVAGEGQTPCCGTDQLPGGAADSRGRQPLRTGRIKQARDSGTRGRNGHPGK